VQVPGVWTRENYDLSLVEIHQKLKCNPTLRTIYTLGHVIIMTLALDFMSYVTKCVYIWLVYLFLKWIRN
jgi:hypothetical protein